MSTNVKHWATWKIKEVLNDPYTRSANGTDYFEYKEELLDELYRRQAKGKA